MPQENPAPDDAPNLPAHWDPNPPGRGLRRFEPGVNFSEDLAVRHGALTKRRREPIAQELINGVYASRPDLLGFPEAVEAWGHAEAAVIQYRAWLAEQGHLDHEGIPRPAAASWIQAERLAAKHRQLLGLDPRAEADLARSRADATAAVVDLDGLRERGRALREAAAEEAQERDVIDGEVL